jgi:hypothetical protein
VGGLTIEAIYLCGSGPEHGALAAQIETQVGIVTHGFDPFAGLSLSAALQRGLPDSPGRFAPVLGMLLDEAEHKRHTVDFLNPRRRPPPPSRSRRLIWSASAACVLLAAGFSWVHSSLAGMDDQISQLRKKAKDLDKPVEKAKEMERAAQEIGAWADSDVNWLDELRELAVEMPPARDVLLTRLNMGANTVLQSSKPGNFAAQIDLEGLLRGAESAAQLEAALRDEFHSVQGRNLQQDSTRSGYAWKFTSSIAATPEPGDSYRKHAEAAEAKRAATSDAEVSGRGRFGFGGGGFGGDDFGSPFGGFGGEGPPGGNNQAAPAKTEKEKTEKAEGASPPGQPAKDAPVKEAANGT